MPMELVYYAEQLELYDFIQGQRDRERIFSIGGIPKLESKDKTLFVMASTRNCIKSALKAGLKPIEEGVATGVSALLLVKSAMQTSANRHQHTGADSART